MALGKHHGVTLSTNSGRNSAHIVINVMIIGFPALTWRIETILRYQLQLVHNYIIAPAGITTEAQGGHIVISFFIFHFSIFVFNFLIFTSPFCFSVDISVFIFYFSVLLFKVLIFTFDFYRS